MKKFSYYLLTLLMSLMFVACSGCTQTSKTNEVADSLIVDTTFADSTAAVIAVQNVENFIATDREEMYLHYAQDYRWYETQIVFNNYLDDEDCNSIESITNVFQFLEGEGESFDTYVVQITHYADTTIYTVDHTFWIEDFPLNNEAIKLTFANALEKLNEANMPNPHSRKCTLRLPCGPLSCNPQYVFGNIRTTAFVDAVTGEVKNSNPAFPDEDGFKMPLGEWP